MEKKLAILWLILYIAGAFLSQSILSVCSILGLVWLVTQREEFKLEFSRAWLWGFAWLLISSMNLFWGGHDYVASDFKRLPLLLLPLLGIVLPLPEFRNPQLKKFFQVAVAVFLALSVAALSRSLFQALVQKRPATGLMSNQIYFAYALLPFFLFTAELSLRSELRKTQRQLAIFFAASFALMLLLSHTRMTWIVVALWGAFRGLPFLWGRPNKKAFGLTLLLALFSGAFLFWYQPDFQNKLGRIFDSQDPSRQSRAVIWNYNFGLFLQHPLLGVGYEKNGHIPSAGETRALFVQGGLNPDYKIYAHNVFIQALVDNGLLGLVFWLGFWFFLSRRHHLTKIYLVFMALAGLTENIFNNSRAAHAFYLGCILFLIFDRMLMKEKENGLRSASA